MGSVHLAPHFGSSELKGRQWGGRGVGTANKLARASATTVHELAVGVLFCFVLSSVIFVLSFVAFVFSHQDSLYHRPKAKQPKDHEPDLSPKL